MSEIHYAIKYPTRISAESRTNFETGAHECWLRFSAANGSDLTVVLSEQQVAALSRLEAADPQRTARDLYVAGHIGIEEFEQRLDTALKGG